MRQNTLSCTMKKYKRISIREREKISQLVIKRCKVGEIAEQTGRHRSTIYREIGRYRDDNGTYSCIDADLIAGIRASERREGYRKVEKYPALIEYVKEKLTLRWSPEQIVMRMKEEYPNDKAMRISHESIYSYIYVLGRGSLKKELISYLRQKKRHRGMRGKKNGRGSIPEMISIEERPKEVEGRIIPGHWEGDLVMGKNHRSALGTLVERTTRTVILVPLEKKDAESVRAAFARELKKLPEQMRLSLTYDQGKEMSQHKLFTRHTRIKVYFAHPHSPWERGTNENTNMLIRDYFPKKTDFSRVTRKQIKQVQHQLNERPRKTLNWKTPKEVFDQLLKTA